MVSNINLEVISQLLLLQIFLLFFSFLSFWYSHYAYVTPFVVVPWFLDILFFFFSVFILFAFQSPHSRILCLNCPLISLHPHCYGAAHIYTLRELYSKDYSAMTEWGVGVHLSVFPFGHSTSPLLPFSLEHGLGSQSCSENGLHFCVSRLL